MSALRSNPVAKWVLAASATAAFLSIVAAHLPDRLGGVARSAPLFAVVCGWLVGWLGTQFGMPKSKGLIVAAGAITAVAFVGSTLESYRLRVEELGEQFRVDPRMFLTTQLLRQAGEADDREAVAAAEKFATRAREDRETVLAARSSFPAFLQYRISSAGRWPHPWPGVFWAGEILLTAALGAWLFTRVAASGHSTGSDGHGG